MIVCVFVCVMRARASVCNNTEEEEEEEEEEEDNKKTRENDNFSLTRESKI